MLDFQFSECIIFDNIDERRCCGAVSLPSVWKCECLYSVKEIIFFLKIFSVFFSVLLGFGVCAL